MIIIILISIWQAYSTIKIAMDNKIPQPLILELGQEYSVAQSIESGQIEVTLKRADTTKYLVAEVTILQPKQDIDLKLSCTKMGLSQSESYIDKNGYAFHKKQNIINIFPNTYLATDILIFQIDISPLNLPHLYKFSVINTENYLCPNNCYGQTCSQENKICECSSNQLDFDCSITGRRLYFQETTSLPINSYIIFEKVKDVNQIQFQFSIPKPEFSSAQTQVRIYVMFENFEYGLPSPYFSHYQVEYNTRGTTEYLNLDLSSLEMDQRLGRYPRVILKAEGNISYEQQQMIFKAIEYKESEGEVDVLMYTLIGSGILIFLIVTIFILRCRQLRNKELAQVNLKISNQHFIPSAPYKEIVDKLKMQNPDIKTDEQCSVCLVEYELISYCRITPCYHIFHAACLNQWLKKYEYCPLCRGELNLDVLKKNQKNALVIQN